MFSVLQQVFDTSGNKPDIVVTIVAAGYLLVLQGKESLVRRLYDISDFWWLLFCFSCMLCSQWYVQKKWALGFIFQILLNII